MPQFSNYTYDELSIGQSASLTRTVTDNDVKAFALVTHDFNPAHLDAEYAEHSPFKGKIVHGMWSAGLISALLGTKFPGIAALRPLQSGHQGTEVSEFGRLAFTDGFAKSLVAKK